MKYICFYDKDLNEGRNISLAATNKIYYISSVVKDICGEVEIISACTTSSIRNFKARRETLENGAKLRLFKAYKKNSFFSKLKSLIYSRFVMFFYLLFNVKRNEKIIVYHSLAYMNQIKLAKAIKKFSLILEVEEIYGEVEKSKKITRKELKYFRKADAYIFPTQLLDNRINNLNKPSTIIHGVYKGEKIISNKFNDGKIHCVYAGTFDSRKGGALLAIKAGEYLGSDYHLHILGFGSKEEVSLVKETIDLVNNKSQATVTFDGLKSGDEYIKFIQSCHIGLSTQNPNAEFNDSSFPSKVLSYMSNGLRVVSIKIKALEKSDINKLLYYYVESSPEEVAKAIMNIDVNDKYDSIAYVDSLNKKFIKEMINLLEKV